VNLRYEGRPERIDVVHDVSELRDALQNSIDENKRVAVRCGGHCLENFVSNSEVERIIDISNMKGVSFNDAMKSFEVMAGTTVGEFTEALYERWQVVVPLGEHPNIGMGGHIAGGAFGFICRQYGLAVDYLCALELLWIDKDRKVRTLKATNDHQDPNFDIWWAHTGGGPGNFGVVTRFWFRSPGHHVDAPGQALPQAPKLIETFELEWSWRDIDEQLFIRLASNFGDWCFENADPGLPTNSLSATLHLFRIDIGKILLKGVKTNGDDDGLIEDFIARLHREATIPYTIKRTTMTWLEFALNPFPDIFSGEGEAFKIKDAFMKRPFSARQLAIAYQYLTSHEYLVPAGAIGHASYGGMVNSITTNSTATFQRSAIMTTSVGGGWQNPDDEKDTVAWMRACYREMFADTGGVPVHNDQTGGSFINHPDADHADPGQNHSDANWHQLYYGDHYERLQKVKAVVDPCNIFKHSLSVQLPKI
jgi:aclacinomycin oxidase